MKKNAAIILIAIGALAAWFFWPKYDVKVEVEKAYALQKSDDHAPALVLFDEVLKHTPQDAHVRKARAESAYLLGLYDDVLLDIQNPSVMESYPRWVVTVKAKVLINTKKYDEAIAYITEHLEEGESLAQMYTLLASASRLKGDDEAATMYRAKAQALQEQNSSSVTKP